MEINKIVGIVLLIIGILLIVIPLLQTYNILTGKTMPHQVFKTPLVPVETKASTLDIQGQMQNALIKILPFEFINNILNLIVWLLLVWILMYGGGKIADIGVKLLNGDHQ